MFISPFDPGRLAGEFGGPPFVADRSCPSGAVTGIDFRTVPPGSSLVVDTSYSRYHIVKVNEPGTNALIQGGYYFPDETKVRIEGSAFTGSLLKIGWIKVGLHMEISAERERIVTSRVRSITVTPNPVVTPSDTLDSAA